MHFLERISRSWTGPVFWFLLCNSLELKGSVYDSTISAIERLPNIPSWFGTEPSRYGRLKEWRIKKSGLPTNTHPVSHLIHSIWILRCRMENLASMVKCINNNYESISTCFENANHKQWVSFVKDGIHANVTKGSRRKWSTRKTTTLENVGCYLSGQLYEGCPEGC